MVKEWKVLHDLGVIYNMDYKLYKEKVHEDFKRVKDFFPLLHITEPPTLSSEFVIYGRLIPFDIYKLTTDSSIEEFSIFVNATYPIEFPEININMVKDVYAKINWQLVPEKHRHKYITGNLCTHHPFGEINHIPIEERSIKILFSAYRLYCQYNSFKGTGIWLIDDLPHGIWADFKLIKEGYRIE